ncbi:hypothetical protein B0T11DRAFT_130561 [Plectosphaerella cucumerina]|uniref:Zn(2)-C6 fungal-type domain-containing protein n=1 Tax=Plectosphaerella cucumerina TaxID=40658 RepID=A0A8K0WYF7_9PEZI|nr:hypothetical protein B0T11DRAFT_130561 [Plectosphaerella cucumerina]
MKTPKACRQCREGKRRCIRPTQAVGEPCEPCKKRKLRCAGILGRQPPVPTLLFPKPEREPHVDGVASVDSEALDVSPEVATILVQYYLIKLHNRPHSLFHPARLLKQVADGSLSRPLLLALCSMGSRFSPDRALRAREMCLMDESKRLLLADLENICVENIQTCILIANLCAAHLNPTSEALFFRIAISMAQIMNIGASPGTLIDLEIRRRTWWTLFMADRWSSSGLGLHRQIRDSGLAVDLPMDEAVFEALPPDAARLDAAWQPGLWAHMISLVQIFGPVQDLNRRSVQGAMDALEIERAVVALASQLDNWEAALPLDMQMSDRNLDYHCARGTGGPFVALHLGYHHYATLLYFRFLEPGAVTPAAQGYRERCTFHAARYSGLVRLARQRGDCDAVYPTVGHMAVVSSAVLLHTLLFGDEEDLAAARDAMNANFEAIVELSQFWPNTASMIHRIVTFQNFCLLSTDYKTHQLDGWMIRFLIEYSLPLEEKDVQPVRSGMSLDMDSFEARTQVMTEQGRYTTFETEDAAAWVM